MEIEEALVNEIESHWTAELGLAFRLRLHLSEGKYQYLINHLSCLYSDKEDKCVRIRVGSGVKMPSFRTHASKQKTVTLMEEYFQDMDPQILEEDEKTITVSLTKVLQGHLQQYPLPEGQTDLLIKIDGDGAPDRLKFQLEHFGVGWHKSNVWGISPEDLVADLLHFDLREVHFMLERTCKRYLLTTEQADSYCQFLADHAGCFIKVKKTSKKQGGKKIKSPNVIGREIDAIMCIYEELLKLIHVEGSERGLAMDYMDAKLDLGSGDQDGTLYSHIAYWHFPEQILRHGDLVDLSTQALEHLH
eukprot:gene8832-10467_t